MTEAADRTEEEQHDEEEEQPAEEAAPAKRSPEPPAAEPLRFSLTTLIAVAMLVGAGAFAAGRSMTPAVAEPPAVAAPAGQGPQGQGGLMGPGGMGGGPGGMGMGAGGEALPPGHPPTGELPPGHPAAGGGAAGMPGAGAGGAGAGEVASLTWKAPERWQQVPNPSTMRLATYRVPHAPGDSEDAELTITQAGGTVEANAQRWIGQFGAEGAKTAKRSTRTVKGLEIAIVEVEGKFANGMGKDSREEDQWAMLGAIVQTPGMPHFLKLTGPAKTVKAARAEFDSLVASLSPK